MLRIPSAFALTPIDRLQNAEDLFKLTGKGEPTVKAMNEIPVTMLTELENRHLAALDDLPVGYPELDACGAITYANQSILDSYPSVHASMIGRTMWALMPTGEQERCCAAFLLQMESNQEPPVVLRCFYTSMGEFRVYELHRN